MLVRLGFVRLLGGELILLAVEFIPEGLGLGVGVFGDDRGASVTGSGAVPAVAPVRG